eukprot:scaffold33667_cov32-Tisochrysis_lutea.AAC.1
MAGGLPHGGRSDDGRVEPDDILALVDEVLPPGTLNVIAQLDAQRPVIVESCEASIDLGGLEDKAAALCERSQLIHRDDGRGEGLGGGSSSTGGGPNHPARAATCRCRHERERGHGEQHRGHHAAGHGATLKRRHPRYTREETWRLRETQA